MDETTGCNGDNDPLDVCEIGSRVAERGSVLRVKVLGTLGLIDEGEADWKIIVIDVNDPIADKLNDIGDVEAHLPGLLEATRDWFKIYKIPTPTRLPPTASSSTASSRSRSSRTITPRGRSSSVATMPPSRPR